MRPEGPARIGGGRGRRLHAWCNTADAVEDGRMAAWRRPAFGREGLHAGAMQLDSRGRDEGAVTQDS